MTSKTPIPVYGTTNPSKADIQSMPVKWQHIEGEKINVGSDGMKMALQTIFISWREKFNWFFVSPFKGKSIDNEPPIYRFLFALLMVQFDWGPKIVSDWVKPFGNIFINGAKM